MNKNVTWLGAVTMAIKAFFSFFVSAINVAEEGVAMADLAVSQARLKQVAETSTELDDFVSKLVDTRAMARVKRELAIKQYVSTTPDAAPLMEHARSALRTAIEAELAKVQSEKSDDDLL